MENKTHLKLKSGYITSPNIAIVKYWGKIDTESIIPLNTSLSFTLNPDDLSTTTKITLSSKYKENLFFLNDKPSILNKRQQKIIDFFKKLQSDHFKSSFNVDAQQLFLKISSKNSFPTASGLASSASGLAAFVLCLGDVFQLNSNDKQRYTDILTRQGSGSACRSLYSGLVQWIGPTSWEVESFYSGIKFSDVQTQNLNDRCVPKQIIEDEKLKSIAVLVLVAQKEAKELPSTDGMQKSVQTSELLKFRALQTANIHLEEAIQSIKEDKWNNLAEIIMKESNQFHAVCLDTLPPIFYLNKFSQKIIEFVQKINTLLEYKVGYTFDAGPHAFLFIHRSNLREVLNLFNANFHIQKMNDKCSKFLQLSEQKQVTVFPENHPKGDILEMILTEVKGSPKKII